MTDFEFVLKQKIHESAQGKVKTLDDIYKGAEDRQNRLFQELFLVCFLVGLSDFISNIDENNFSDKISILIKRGIILESKLPEIKSILLDTKISAFDRVNCLFGKNLFNIQCNTRSEQEKFLIDNKDIFRIYLLDGNVKKRERAEEKIHDRYAEDCTQINDINRLTVVSDNSALIENVFSILKSRYSNDFCCRERWEMKNFGMITRSSYLFIEGFPCEIHFNDPLQMELSRRITHKIYEAFRFNTDTNAHNKKFEKLFLDIIELIKQPENSDVLKSSVGILKDEYSSGDFSTPTEINKRKKELLHLHIKLHQEKALESCNEWQIDYLSSLFIFNMDRKEEAKMQLFVRFQDFVAEKANQKYIDLTKASNSKDCKQ